MENTKKKLMDSIFESLVAFSVASINLAKRLFLLEAMMAKENELKECDSHA